MLMVAPARVRLLPLFHYCVDALVWAFAVVTAVWMRFDFDLSQASSFAVGRAVLLVVAAQGVFGLWLGIYRRRWRYGSFDEVVALAGSVALAGLALSATTWAAEGRLLPRSVPLLAMGVTLSGTVAARSAWRLWKERSRRPSSGEPLVVVGAGEAAV
jgi:FlaA1/EpsC-like NDP-sugar epimerase